MPPSVNGLYATDFRTRRRFRSKAYAAWLALVTPLQTHAETFTTALEASYRVGRPDKRKRDVMSYEKALTDLLVSWGVMLDDSQIVDIRLRWDDTVEKGFVEAEIKECGPL